MHMDLYARNLSIANNWIMSTPSLSRMFTDIGRLITSLIPPISHASTFTTRIPLNLSWNQFINYHIIKFKYKYYMVSYYVFGITVNSTAYCIIQLAARVRCTLVRSFIAMRSSYCEYKWYQCNSILNGKLCGLLSMNHENDQLKFIWISLAEHIELIVFNLAKMICDTLFIHSNTFHMDGNYDSTFFVRFFNDDDVVYALSSKFHLVDILFFFWNTSMTCNKSLDRLLIILNLVQGKKMEKIFNFDIWIDELFLYKC